MCGEQEVDQQDHHESHYYSIEKDLYREGACKVWLVDKVGVTVIGHADDTWRDKTEAMRRRRCNDQK